MERNVDVLEKIKDTYTKEMLIKKIAEECHRDYYTVRSIYNTLEKVLTELLSSATIDKNISVRLFEGISIDSEFLPEKTKVNNLTGETIMTLKKVKPKANITRNYCEKLTAYNK